MPRRSASLGAAEGRKRCAREHLVVQENRDTGVR
jgi:hypothetical protein